MKKIYFWFVVVFALLLLSCSPTRSDPLAVMKKEARAEIVIEKNGCRVGGVITLGAAPGAGERDFTITLSSPETVNGTVIKCIGGKLTASRDGISLDTDAFVGVAELFSVGSVSEIKLTERDGVRLTRVTSNANGCSVNIYLNGEGIPVLMESERFCVRIVWFEAE